MHLLTTCVHQHLVSFRSWVMIVLSYKIEHCEISDLTSNQRSLLVHYEDWGTHGRHLFTKLVSFHLTFLLRFLVQEGKPCLIKLTQAIRLPILYLSVRLQPNSCLKSLHLRCWAPLVPKSITEWSQNSFANHLIMLFRAKIQLFYLSANVVFILLGSLVT